MDSTTYNKLANTLAIAKADEEIKIVESNLAIAKLNRELLVAQADLTNSADNDLSPEPAKKAALPKKARTQADTKAAQTEDLKKVKAAAAEKTAKDLGAEVKLSDVYKEGKVNMLGFLAPLHLLTPEQRLPYIVDVELDKTKHTDAVEHGVMHLDLVQEVIDNAGTPAEKFENKPMNPAAAAKVNAKLGEKLVAHMSTRTDQKTLGRDLQTMFKAV